MGYGHGNRFRINSKFCNNTGILEIGGDARKKLSKRVIRTINYVNLEDEIDDRTTFADEDRVIILAVGFETVRI